MLLWRPELVSLRRLSAVEAQAPQSIFGGFLVASAFQLLGINCRELSCTCLLEAPRLGRVSLFY